VNVLLIDDDIECLKSIGKALRINGIPNAQFTNPVKAIASYKATDYDVVVTDMKMPHMSGLELTREIRDFDPDARVIILSAFDDEHNKEKAKRCGAEIFLHKSVSFEKFLHIIEGSYVLNENAEQK